MRHQWMLLGVCGWVLLLLWIVSKFITFRGTDDYAPQTVATDYTRIWVQSGTKVAPPERPAVKPSDLPSPLPSATDWQAVVDRRLALLSSVCENNTLRNLTHVSVNKFVLDRIFVCDKQRILFCQTPKVGNTQWKKVLIVLNGEFPTVEEIPESLVHDHEKNGLPRLSSFTPADITERLRTYFKFFIVRDPFERLISAFKDKFVKNPRFEPWYQHDIAPAIIRKYRRKRDDAGGQRGLRFEDFVRYLSDTEGGRRRVDRQFGEHVIHWATYAELCAPCQIRYTAVGHHETLERDAPHILQAAGIQGLVSYPAIPPGITRYNRSKVEQYFKGIRQQDVNRLYARYRGDFHLFGYPSPNFLLK